LTPAHLVWSKDDVGPDIRIPRQQRLILCAHVSDQVRPELPIGNDPPPLVIFADLCRAEWFWGLAGHGVSFGMG